MTRTWELASTGTLRRYRGVAVFSGGSFSDKPLQKLGTGFHVAEPSGLVADFPLNRKRAGVTYFG